MQTHIHIVGVGQFRPPPRLVASSPAFHGSSSTFYHQPLRQYAFPYSAYGYSGYSQDTLYPTSYYNVYGAQQFSAYYPSAGASGAVGLIHNIYPFYGQYAESIQAQSFGVQYPQMAQFSFLPQHYGSTGILSYPSSVAVPTTSAVRVIATTTTTSTSTGVAAIVASSSQATTSEHNSTSWSLQG